ncbi:MAG: hypothetical protein V4521_15740, partial [Pseudomonadota bacterium]
NFPISHGAGVLMVVALAGWRWVTPPATLAFVGLTVAILAIVALWEWVSFHGGWQDRFGTAGKREA